MHVHKTIYSRAYYSELQPIDIILGPCKNSIVMKCDFTIDTLLKQLNIASKKVTAKICFTTIKSIQNVKNKYLNKDVCSMSSKIIQSSSRNYNVDVVYVYKMKFKTIHLNFIMNIVFYPSATLNVRY